MNRLVIPRWDAWMSNRGKAASMFESWLAVQLRETPPCDMVTQLLQFLEMVFQGGMFCYGEDHRDLFQNVPAFFEKMLRHEGQLGYTPHTLSSRFDIYIYICVCYFFMWFCSMQRKLYNHLTSILYEKHIHMRVLFHCEMCFSQNPMRYQVEDQKLWLIDESTGWWEEKKYVVIVWRKPLTSCTMWTLQTSCSSGLNPVFLLCNGNNSNIYIYIYAKHVQFMFTKNFSWIETHEHPHIYVSYDHIYSIWTSAWCYHVTGVCVTIYTNIIAVAANKLSLLNFSRPSPESIRCCGRAEARNCLVWKRSEGSLFRTQSSLQDFNFWNCPCISVVCRNRHGDKPISGSKKESCALVCEGYGSELGRENLERNFESERNFERIQKELWQISWSFLIWGRLYIQCFFGGDMIFRKNYVHWISLSTATMWTMQILIW